MAVKFRTPHRYIRNRISPRDIQGLSTTGSVDDELWSLLSTISDVHDSADEYLKSQGIANASSRRKVLQHIKAYVRHARELYYSGKATLEPVASLYYYYSFMNLAKVALVVSTPKLAGAKLVHGLSARHLSARPINKQTVKVTPEKPLTPKEHSVFNKFYSWYFDSTLPARTFLNTNTLLGYCNSIGYQYGLLKAGEGKSIPAVCANCFDAQAASAWTLIGIRGYERTVQYKKSFCRFLDVYEKVEDITPEDKSIIKDVFGLNAWELHDITFFQNKQLLPANVDTQIGSKLKTLLLKTLGTMFSVNYLDEKADFKLSLPYSWNKQIAMDETIATYIFMYYLAHLVRYQPNIFDAIKDKKSALLIPSFIRFSPNLFLRSITSRLLGRDYVITRL